MDWTQFAAFILVNILFNLTLWLWSRNESRNDSRQIIDLISAVQNEMKDFHARLAVQDMEFKLRMGALEERGKK